MKDFLVVSLVLTAYILSDSVGQPDNQDGAGIQMSYTISNGDSSSVDPQPAVNTSTGAHTNVGVWRARYRGHGHGRNESGRGGALRRYRLRQHHRRRPQLNLTASAYPHSQGRRPQRLGNVQRRAEQLRRQGGTRRLVATGSHTLSTGTRTNTGGVDPFMALQNGHRQTGPFQDRQTAYDFLSNGGNSFRLRNENQRERRDENARMASVMCGVFGKQFVPSAIGGRCVDPA
ncbi:uncharacterized protein [Haliotis cracherodii]|uniref:uncharacterized protein n=1 Tax=Haliotis cracherodii TaxID=6455 RepID=UPI0039E93386